MFSLFRDAGVQVTEFFQGTTKRLAVSSEERECLKSAFKNPSKPNTNPTKQQTKHAFESISPISNLLNRSTIGWEESNLNHLLKGEA